MGVDSYLELFTTAYGWTLANLVYSILLDTGIVFIPLIVTIVMVWAEAHVDGSENGGPEWAIRKMEIELGTAIFVMAVCFFPNPFTTLDKTYLTFKPDGSVAVPSPAVVNGGASGTTFDNAFGTLGAAGAGANGVPVPLWWYTAMGLSSGINSAIRAGVSNSVLGLRQAEELARLATIEDPALRGEAQAFRAQCFVPAHAKFHSMDAPPLSAAAKLIAVDPRFGKDDTEWIGSRIFQMDPNYYAQFRARQSIAGFAPEPAGDDKDAPPGDNLSLPNCLRWWATPTVGLRSRLMDQSGTRLKRAADYTWGILNSTNTGAAPTPAGTIGPDLDYVKDQILRQALWRSQSNFVQTDQVIGGQNASRWQLPELLSGLGIAEKSLEASFSYYPIVQFLTLAQPLILLALYFFLPFITVFSRFSLSFMMYGALAIFTVKFWAAMWAVARFMDERLVVAMYGDNTMLVREYITNGLDGGSKRMVLNALTLAMFLGLPLVWSGMMAWIGFQVGKGVSSIMESAYSSGKAAGSTAMSRTGQLGGAAIRKMR